MARRRARVVLVLAALALCALPGRAAAYTYSYGGAAQDALADAYEAFAGALAAQPPDWQAAGRQVAEVAPEVRLVFGECALRPLEEALGRRDAEAARAAFRRLLVLQLARRLAQARDALEDDYPTAKAALARASRVYEVLAAEVKAADAAADARIRAELEAMAGDLGNPGLFGVGRRAPDPASFDRRRQAVLTELQGRFGPKGVDPLRLHLEPCPGEAAGPGGGGGARGRPWAWAAAAGALAAAAGVAWALRRRARLPRR